MTETLAHTLTLTVGVFFMCKYRYEQIAQLIY